MGQAPRELTPWRSAVHFFGAQVRRWRTLRRLSQATLGTKTHDSSALIGKIEKGERYPSLALARRLDEALDTGGALERLWPQVERERAAIVAPGGGSSGGKRDIGDLGLAWPATPDAAIALLGELWRLELERRSVLAVPWVASAFVGPTQEWLLDRQDADLRRQVGRLVGRSDVAALWAMSEAFFDAHGRCGGGYARSTLVHYLDQVVFPLLQGSYSDAVGRELMAATARLCDLCAVMSFDDGQQGLAQRHSIQGLRLAQASGDRALGALILSNMSRHAQHVGDAAQALALAQAGYRSGLDGGSPVAAAKCAAMQGRAHALGGDHRACAQARTLAERTLDQAVPADEPAWIRFFTPEQLSAETLYIASDLGRPQDVQRLAPDVIVSSGDMGYRRVMRITTLAASYLPSERNSGGDIDHAAELLCQVIPTLGSLHSSRILHRVNSVRRALAAHAARPSVQALEHLALNHGSRPSHAL